MEELYLKGKEYATQNEEVDAYRKSKIENRECAKEIINQINDNTDDNQRIDMKSVLENVKKNFSDERISFVVASTVVDSLHDGRYNPEVKEWANEMYSKLPEDVRKNPNENRISDTCHAIVINGFAKKVIENENLNEIKKVITETADLIADFCRIPKEDIYKDNYIKPSIINDINNENLSSYSKENLKDLAYNLINDCSRTIGYEKEDFIKLIKISEKTYDEITDLNSFKKNDIVAFVDVGTAYCEKAYVKEIDKDNITIAFSLQDSSFLSDCPYQGNGVEVLSKADVIAENTLFKQNFNYSEEEQKEIINDIDKKIKETEKDKSNTKEGKKSKTKNKDIER